MTDEKLYWAGQVCILANNLVDNYIKAKALAKQFTKRSYGGTDPIEDSDIELLKGPTAADLMSGAISVVQFINLMDNSSTTQDDHLGNLQMLEMPNNLLSRFR